MTRAIVSPTHRDWLQREVMRLLGFGRGFPDPEGGAAYLDASGFPDPTRPVHTWITARMAHVYGLGALMDLPGSGLLADEALAGLTGRLRDDEHGGWFASSADDTKAAYAHAFVVLAAATCTVAERPGAAALLDEALTVLEERFWDDEDGLVVDAWDRPWKELDPYRGLNANMHAVEALLAAYDATGDRLHAQRAARISAQVRDWAAAHDWRIPEHFAEDWTPVLELNVDRPDDPFKPYGATVGHGFEWSRLMLQVAATLGPDAPGGLEQAAVALFDRAREDGWDVDGAPGFVYTTDWSGRPVVRDRMHWVAAEATAAAAALHRATGEEGYLDWYHLWWDHIADVVIDHELGSWHHQLDPGNRPVSTVWPGKPDLYHAVQACLLPRLPLAPGLAKGIRDGLLD